jgi:hypothetical protein
VTDRGRTAILLVGSLLLFVGIGLLAYRGTAFDYTRDHASDRTNPWGAKAWRELLGRSGLTTRTWSRPLDELPEEVQTLVLLDPVEPITAEEQDGLLSWVRGGGRLIFAPFAKRPSDASMHELLTALGLRRTLGAPLGEAVPRRSDLPVTADASAIVVPTEARLHPEAVVEAGLEPITLFADEHGAAAVQIGVGEGIVIAVAEAEVFANATLREADNVVFAANVIFDGGAPDVVYFDEYHRGGERPGEVFGTAEVDPTPVWNTALALLAVATIYALGRARRFGAPVADAGERRRGSADYVSAFAQLYDRADAAGAAAAMLSAALRRRLAASSGAPSTAPPEALVRGLKRRGLPTDELTGLLARLESADDDLSERELLALAQQVARYERML